ncbi:MAG: hypothetical protein AVDCRST_MAG22-2434, partial [uncultured Rubrobacteraceae bacterium]
VACGGAHGRPRPRLEGLPHYDPGAPGFAGRRTPRARNRPCHQVWCLCPPTRGGASVSGTHKRFCCRVAARLLHLVGSRGPSYFLHTM